MSTEPTKRPTIAELEAILNDPNPGTISIAPDGSVHVLPHGMARESQAEVDSLRSRLAAAEIEAERLKKNLSDSYAATPPDGFISVKKADLEGMIAEGERNEVLAARVPHLETKLAAAESRLAALERDGERLKELEGVIRKIWNEADRHWEYNPIGKVSRQPLGYVAIKSFAESVIAFPVTTHAPLSDAARQADAATGETEGK